MKIPQKGIAKGQIFQKLEEIRTNDLFRHQKKKT